MGAGGRRRQVGVYRGKGLRFPRSGRPLEVPITRIRMYWDLHWCRCPIVDLLLMKPEKSMKSSSTNLGTEVSVLKPPSVALKYI